MNKRNYSVDIYKLFFAFVIAFGHFGTSIFHSGIVVNCFFIVSGYFLINSFNSNKYSSSFEYTKNKLSKIYPYYLFAFFSLLLVHLLTNLKNKKLP